MKICCKGHPRGIDIPENEKRGLESVAAREKLKNRVGELGSAQPKEVGGSLETVTGSIGGEKATTHILETVTVRKHWRRKGHQPHRANGSQRETNPC